MSRGKAARDPQKACLHTCASRPRQLLPCGARVHVWNSALFGIQAQNASWSSKPFLRDDDPLRPAGWAPWQHNTLAAQHLAALVNSHQGSGFDSPWRGGGGTAASSAAVVVEQLIKRSAPAGRSALPAARAAHLEPM